MGTSNSSPSRRLLVAAVALFVLLGLGIDWWKRRATRAPARAVRLTSGAGLHTEPAISPDGKLVAYASDRGGGALQVWAQPAGGGAPWRISSGEGDCHSPAFSANGAEVAWRNEDGGGAVWTAAVRGGVPRKIAEGGRDPRYSPDGRWLAWWVRRPAGRDEVWAARVDGSEPRRVCPQCDTARYPVWAPDSRRLVFLAASRGRRDWDAAPLDGGPPAPTGARSILQLQNFGGDLVPTAWARDAILFTGQVNRAAHIWRMPISPDTLQCTTGAQQLTSGSGYEAHAAASATGAVVYSSEALRTAVWELTPDSRRPTASGEPRKVADADPAYPQFSVSADGRHLALRRENEIRLRDLASGEEKGLPPHDLGNAWPLISPDGARVAYGVHGAGFLRPVAGGEAERMGGYTGIPLAWSRDGTRILCHGRDRSLTLAYPSSLRDRPREVLRHSEASIDGPQFSPDGRWIALYTRWNDIRRVWIAAFRDGPQPKDDEWIAVTRENGDDRNPVWSGDGNLLYYLSGRDGFRCIWAQALDPATKRPRGAPVAVRHFHGARLSLTNPRNSSAAGFAAAGGKLYMTLFETTADVWMLPAGK